MAVTIADLEPPLRADTAGLRVFPRLVRVYPQHFVCEHLVPWVHFTKHDIVLADVSWVQHGVEQRAIVTVNPRV